MKILYLIPKYIHDAKTDHGRVLHGKAVARQPGVELRFGGAGWSWYDEGRTVQQNLDAWGWRPDWLWVYCPVQPKGREKWAPLRGLAEAQAPRVICFYDAYQEDKFLAEVDAAQPAAVLFAQESDVTRHRAELSRRLCVVGYLPNCAEKSIFCRDQYGERPIDCLLTGARNAEVYPWRDRWARLIHSGRIPGVVRPHPGHRTGGIAETERQITDYAQHLRLAKILLCDSSQYRLFLQRYAEAAAAGCMIVSDMPDDDHFRKTLGPYIVEVNNGMSDDELIAIVEGELAEPGRIKNRALGARERYLWGFTADHWARRFLEVVGN